MSARQIFATFLALILFVGSSGFAGAADPPPPPPGAPPAPPGAATRSSEATPARLSYINGDVAFWRPGTESWTPASLNTPLAPGDALNTGTGGNVEIQVGPRAFVRAAEGTQLGLDSQEPDFLRLRLTAGHAALDLRRLAPGQTVELETPNGVFTVERTGYYHVQVSGDSTVFATFRGGSATLTPAGGAPTAIAANQRLIVSGVDAPRVQVGGAPQLSAWDRWNYERTDSLLRAASARYVGPDVYGADALDQYGSWRTVDTYGSVWVPTSVSTGWVPYSTGRWIWDPRFGWTWLDDAPWGWAPYHYGRWVSVGDYWAWAPGPVVVRPAYSPALVVFLGGGGASVSVSIGAARPLCWAPLGWGEPVIPWWGRAGFVGVASWRGWGGPRVVNNVVVNRVTSVNVTNINVYRNVHVTDAVVGVPAERFGRGHERPQRIGRAEVRQLTPVRGALEVQPIAVTPALRESERRTSRATPAPAAAPRIAPFRRATAPSAVMPGGGIPSAVAPARTERERREPEPRRGSERARDDRRDDRRTNTSRPEPPRPQEPERRVAPTPAPRVETVPLMQTMPPAPRATDAPPARREAAPVRPVERPVFATPPTPSAPPARAAVAPARFAPPSRIAPAPVAPPVQFAPPARVAPRQDGGQRQEREQRQGRNQSQERGDRHERRG